MPTSSREGKSLAREEIHRIIKEENLQVRKVLDIGPGRGNWLSWMEQVKWHGRQPNKRDGSPLGAEWHGVEAWQEYIDRFHLLERYADVRCMDARSLDDEDFRDFDMVVFGDVLEHMTIEEAQKLWGHAVKNVKVVVVSIPIKDVHQGATGGNPYERHVVPNWSHEMVMEKMPGAKVASPGKTVGVYIWY